MCGLLLELGLSLSLSLSLSVLPAAPAVGKEARSGESLQLAVCFLLSKEPLLLLCLQVYLSEVFFVVFLLKRLHVWFEETLSD